MQILVKLFDYENPIHLNICVKLLPRICVDSIIDSVYKKKPNALIDKSLNITKYVFFFFCPTNYILVLSFIDSPMNNFSFWIQLNMYYKRKSIQEIIIKRIIVDNNWTEFSLHNAFYTDRMSLIFIMTVITKSKAIRNRGNFELKWAMKCVFSLD